MSTRKVAIITGASRGTSAPGLVAGYRRRDWAVVASARTIKSSPDPDLLTVAADITEPGTAGQIVDTALERFGRIDTLVNNAGVCISKPFTDYTAADYAAVVGVNLSGFFAVDPAGHRPDARPRGGGHVVNIIDDVGRLRRLRLAPSVLTSLTRGGRAAATKSLAIEYASRGIRVNAVSPGIIRTSRRPATRKTYDAIGPLAALNWSRRGQVRDIVEGILFLESSPFITGEILHIDGGQIAGNSELFA